MPQTVVITGSSKGIGKATALYFAKKGWNVVVNSEKSVNDGQKVANEIVKMGARAIYIQANVSEKAQAENLIKQAEKVFGKIDCLVNNASRSQKKLFIDTIEADYELSNTGLKGAINCSRAVIKSMKDQGGTIVNISSIWGISGASGEVLYSASKAAIIGLSKALAKEMGTMGIRVNAVAPGYIETRMTRGEKEETRKHFCENSALGKLGTPEDIAKVVYFLASDSSSFITGQTITADGGYLD